jgi:hypothetical protein
VRPGRAGPNTAADHIELLDLAVAQIPDAWRSKTILVRSDGAGFSHALLTHLAARFGYSVGWPVTEAVRAAIATLVRRSWSPAIETDGELRDGADVAELTGLLDLSAWPDGIRIIVRRERPHPGAQLSVFEHRDGYRYQTFATNTPHGRGGLAFLEARHPPTLESRTASAARKTPAWAACPHGKWRSTPPGSNSSSPPPT